MKSVITAENTALPKQAAPQVGAPEPSETPTKFPLSFAQERLWFLDQLEPNSPLYNIPVAARLTGKLDIDALEKSLAAIVERHEALRTRFVCEDSVPAQIVEAGKDFKLRLVELKESTPIQREQEINQWLQIEARKPFDLSQDLLVRASLLSLDQQTHVLMLVLHHIVADEWSLKVFWRELSAFYKGFVEGESVTLPELPVQYTDYTLWQRDWLQGAALDHLVSFWKRKLSGSPPVLELPSDRPRRLTPSFRGKSKRRSLGKSLSETVKDLADQEHATLFMVLLAAFKALLHRYTQQDDIVVASPMAGRTRVEVEPLVGFFVNTLPLRTDVSGNPSFRELLRRVREVTLEAHEHQDLPFEKLVEELHPERSLDHMPFSQVVFAVQNQVVEELQWPGAIGRLFEIDTGTAKFDITFVLLETVEGLVAHAEYSRDVFDDSTLARLLEHFECLLSGAIANPDLPLSELPLLTDDETRLVLEEWNRTQIGYPREQCIHQIFEAVAQQNQNSLAVKFPGSTLTYGELNARANQLARHLKKYALAPEAPIGICTERSTEMLVGILGILKAGGAYVPLDPANPSQRLGFMLKDVHASVLLTQQSLLGHLRPGLPAEVECFCLDSDWQSIEGESTGNLQNTNKADGLAYVMFTSGSTGQPKGVAVPHMAVNRLVLNTNYIDFGKDDRVAQVSNVSFDAATFEIWGALLNGGQLVGINKDLALSPVEFSHEVQAQGITAMFLTSALFNQLVAAVPGALRTVRTVIAGGEALDPKSVRKALREGSPQRLMNGYGPTENTTFTCCHLIREVPEDATSIPVGKPIANTQVYILDSHLKPLPVGIPGELYCGGDGVARGYWNRPSLTKERFVRNPFSPHEEARLYRTGDLARWLPDGTLEFMGRRDQQVKLRGFRIETGEIEAALSEHPGVRECAVALYGEATEDKRLVAYFTSPGAPRPKASELCEFLRQKLPDYMVPAAFIPLDSLPLNANGKVDRKALPAPDGLRPELERKYAAPGDEVESKLVQIWERVLRVQPVGISDKFFDLGGHSLLAVRLISEIEKGFGRKLRLATIFQAPTVQQLASILREEVAESKATTGSLVEIQGKGTKAPFFLVHGAGGGMFWGYANLAHDLSPEVPVYGFKARGLDGREEFDSIEAMAAEYVADLQTRQPHGPYRLGGYCFGGNVAFEMARQLEGKGETVSLLALFNSAPPNSRYLKIPWTPLWWMRLARNMAYWVKYFYQWTRPQRRGFFKWKWSKFKRRIGLGPESASGVNAGDLVDLSKFTPEEKRTWEAHIKALVKFHPQAFTGRVHLFRSPGHPLWCSYDPAYGWGDFARGGVEITIIPAVHEKIMEEPFVAQVAKHLRKVLIDECESNGALELDSSTNTSGALTPQRNSNTETQTKAAAAEPPTNSLSFWKQRLADAPALLELATDHPRPASQSQQIETARSHFGRALRDGVLALGTRMNTDWQTILLASLGVLLRRYTRQEEFVIGVAARNQEASPNFVPFRMELRGTPSFRDIVASFKARQTEAEKHQIAFENLVGELCPAPDASYHPIFQVAFSAGSEPKLQTKSRFGTFDLVFHFAELDGALVLELAYAKELFEAETIGRLLGNFEVLIKGILQQPDARISELPLLTTAEEKLFLEDWVNTAQDYPRNKTLVDLFEEQVARTPDAEALVFGDVRLTYRDLHAKAEIIANRLKALGVGNETLVGVCLERSWEMVTGLLGVLQAGAAYLPLDPAYPAERLAYMLEDAKVRVLLTQKKLASSLPQSGATLLCVEEVLDDGRGAGALSQQQAANNPRSSLKPHHLAYVIYTSGSTGKPKGVPMEHRSAVAFVSWARGVFTDEELSGVLAATSMCFDVSIFEMFVPLCWGGKVIIAENVLALPSIPASNEVRMAAMVPSAIRELLRVKSVPDSLQVVSLAGEALSAELSDQIYNESPVRKVYDLYGPTETTTYSTFALRIPGGPATIGKPLANEQVYLLDSALQLVPLGVPGELYIGGDGLARGYLNQPQMTDERFVAHPFKKGERLYRTGDLARWRPDGNLEYLGRIDHQVKIRGFRVELGEIEKVLKAQLHNGEVVVVAHEEQPGDKRLVAYIAGTDGSLSASELRTRLRKSLPEYMVPSAFMFLEAMPRTPNGKLDRKALPAPEFERQGRELVEPRTPTEHKLHAIWREVLRMKEVGVTDNFFELGGHSLLAIQINSRIRELFHVELPLFSLFDAPTIAELAAGLDANKWKKADSEKLAVRRVSRESKLPASSVQSRLWFLDQLRSGNVAYNVPAAFRLIGNLDIGVLRKACNEVIRRHEALRTVFQEVGGELTQVIWPALDLDLEVTELKGHSAENGSSTEELVKAWAQREAQRPFDLARGPLLRAKVARIADHDHVLLVVMHHTISDGWSIGIFFNELSRFYEAFAAAKPAPQLPALPVQYADFAAWQQQKLAGQDLAHDLEYWKTKLAGSPEEVALPADLEDFNDPRAGLCRVSLGHGLSRKLAAFCRREGSTPFALLMTALALTIKRWTHQKDLVLGTVVAGRNRREFENLIGCFMNFLPIRVTFDNSKDCCGRDVLRQLRTTILEAQAHAECPFEKIVAASRTSRKSDHNPLYNVALLLQNFEGGEFTAPGIQAKPLPVSLESALLDLRFVSEQRGHSFEVECEFKRGLFKPDTAEQLLASFQDILETLIRKPDTKVDEFALTQALVGQAETARAREPQRTMAIAATFTAEPVADSLQFWSRELDFPFNVEFAPYNQVFQELLDPASLLAANKQGLNVILLRLEDWERATKSESSSRAERQGNVKRNAKEFLATVKAAAAHTSTPFLVCICPVRPAVAADATQAAFFGEVEHLLESELENQSGVYCVGTRELQELYPVADYYDQNAEELGHVPYTPAFFAGLGTLLLRKFHALNRPPRKVIVLDCDQTLWSGVCGEDGAMGICIDGPRKALQQFMRAQQEAGVLLCLCSKNNESDVRDVFSQRLDMALRSEHITGWRLNWQAKSENIKSLAKELQLGLDSFVFIDDNPVECAEVEAHCPEVLTLLLPENPELLPQFLKHCWVFDRLKLTSEDRRRTEMYQQNREREALRAQAPSLAEFIASLELNVQCEPLAGRQLSRASQLSQRTNQFNCTTRRYSEPDLQKLLNDSEAVSVSVSDRFGDYGMVGLMIFQEKGPSLDVDTFLLSCRVLGRGVEHRMLSELGKLAQERGLDWLDVHFVKTARNKPAMDFLTAVGAEFQQPLNGGFVFRFPAKYAAGLLFTPAAATESVQSQKDSITPARIEKQPAQGKPFPCRRIALEANDAAAIHRRLEKQSAVKALDQKNYLAPRTEKERELCALWQKLLRVDRVGVRDNFFELGGHSLLAVRLFAELERITGRRSPLVTIFQSPTVEQLARALTQTHLAAHSELLVPLQPQGSKPPLILVHGAGGDVLWGYAKLAAHLPADQPLYGIRSRGQAGLEEPGTLEEMANHYLEELRTLQPEGPYYLGGYCFGGNVAYEMARQLRARGEEVAMVLLLDSAPANAGYERITWWRPAFSYAFARNLAYWLSDFDRSSANEKRRYLKRKLRWLARKLKQRLTRENNNGVSVDVEQIVDPVYFSPAELELWRIHLQALTDHVQGIYPGKIILLRTRGQPLFCSFADDFCWSRLAKGGVALRRIPGSHENIFMEPNVKFLAAQVQACLEEARLKDSQPPVNLNHHQ